MKLETCEPKCAWVFSNKPKQTECCHYLDVSPKEGNWLPLLNNGRGLDGEDHLLVPELRLLGPAVGGGVSGRPAGEDHQRILFMWHSSKVAGLSQGSENITDENTCTGTMLERLPKSAQNRHHVPIIKARMLMMIKRHMWSELVRETVSAEMFVGHLTRGL